jgi:FtsP/CotA-like multicopper oxidase with cupredoxin domain
MIPSAQDGATEEGSPIIDPGKSLTYSFVPKPSGTRWYHSHAMAMTDLSKSTYSGEFGFLIVEPAAGDPGSYDSEVLLAAHHWDGHWELALHRINSAIAVAVRSLRDDRVLIQAPSKEF